MNRIESIHIITRRLILMTLVAIVLFTTVFGVSFFFNERFMMTWAAFLCGIVGGFVSLQQRLPKVTDEELALLTRSWFQILLVPIFGGVFALVLYCIFLSGIVTGSLFPEFHYPPRPDDGPDSGYMIEVFTLTYPNSGQDLARFLFWSFVAGFSERFVPQIITKVSSSAAER
ncbi:hypothetical protein ACM26W_10490 [Halomonas sp. HK25]|uniref:hypothetical protein n=1 Tax=Halomonas sp. HK25 TaxID=3394321 RepID=UPI0039FBC960